MRGESLLSDVVHASAAYLHLHPFASLTHERGVQSLVAVGLLVVDPVAQAVGMRLVYGAHDVVYLEALGCLVHALLRLKDDAHGQDVVYLLESDVLGLHLVPDAVGRLDARLYLVAQSRRVESLADRSRELVEDGVQVLAYAGQLLLDAAVFLRVLVAEAQVLQLFLDFVQAESVGQRCVDVERLASYFVLLAGELASQGTHVVQTVRDLDEYDAYVVAHRQQEFLEGLCLHRCFVAKDAARNLCHAIHDLSYLWTEDVRDVFHRIVGILHDVVEQRCTDAGAAKSYLFAGDSRHGDGVHDVWLARESADAFVCLLSEVEGLVDDFGVLSVAGCQIGIHELLVGFAHHHLVFLFPDVLFFHSVFWS